MTYKTEQESFWHGQFGNDYVDRNSETNSKLISGNINLFSRIISVCDRVESVIEFGSNIGLNLIAMKHLMPELKDISAVEINERAADILEQRGICRNIYRESILDFSPDRKRDFVFTKGVCIHLNPDWLEKVYEVLYQSSSKYICMIEYYNPTPVTVPYRGNNEHLFKRDFAGELMDRYPDVHLLDYGFVYHRDRHFPLDDLTWFLMKKE